MSAGPKHTRHFRAPYSLLYHTVLMSAANILLYLNPETVVYVFFRHHTQVNQRNLSSSKSVRIKHNTNSDTCFPLCLVGQCFILIPVINKFFFFLLYIIRTHLLSTVSFCIVRSILRSFFSVTFPYCACVSFLLSERLLQLFSDILFWTTVSSISRSSSPIYKVLYIKRTTDCSTMTKENRNADNLWCSVWRILLRFVSFMPNKSGSEGMLIRTKLWSCRWARDADNPRSFHLRSWLTKLLGPYPAAWLRSVTPSVRNLPLKVK
jgi:hypothetical protein